MHSLSPELLALLGAGEPIAQVAQAAGLSSAEFKDRWRQECQRRVPRAAGTVLSAVTDTVRIERDRWGIPRIFARNDDDLFFGFGYAVAQDRLFQLDYLRRRALGRLSEILGPESLEADLTARTVGLPQIAQAEWEWLPEETRKSLIAYSNGINALIDDSAVTLPIEFDLLGYRPEPWRPQDCLAIIGEFRWYLTGRFPVIAIPELARRTLGDGPLYEAFLLAEAGDEAILPAGSYPPRRSDAQPVGATINDPQEGVGSNNWVVSGTRSQSEKPLLASDPHIAFAAVSCWHEVHLCGGTYNVAGTAYAGMPAVLIGRNERVAWGITNNICSLRDLYQERTDPAHPGCFEFDGQWEPARERIETISIKGQDPLRATIRLSRNGPIVNEILPAPARDTGPVSLRWLGFARCGWLPALQNMNRAKTCQELRQATEPWLVPTFCLVFADIFGHIGYQCTGRIPIRDVAERGYRPGWDPRHQWAGLIPFDDMPQCSDPTRGWIGTANNRVAPDDYPYPLSGTWTSGYRAVRIRQMIEGQPKFRRQDFARLHQDSVSLRAVECIPPLLDVLRSAIDHCEPTGSGAEETGRPRRTPIELTPDQAGRIYQAIEYLAVWDCRMEPDRVGATIFNVFFTDWCQRIADQRFSGDTATLMAGANSGLAVQLLSGDRWGWFQPTADGDALRRAAIVRSFLAGLEFLKEKFGDDPLQWSWGRLHTLQQQHFLSGRGELGALLDRGGVPVRGDYVTVCNTGQAADFSAPTGAGFRMIADLADRRAGLWAIDAGSESGHPGSPHYGDQLPEWQTSRYHYIPLRTEGPSPDDQPALTLSPKS